MKKDTYATILGHYATTSLDKVPPVGERPWDRVLAKPWYLPKPPAHESFIMRQRTPLCQAQSSRNLLLLGVCGASAVTVTQVNVQVMIEKVEIEDGMIGRFISSTLGCVHLVRPDQ